jgi:hypothetical protein
MHLLYDYMSSKYDLILKQLTYRRPNQFRIQNSRDKTTVETRLEQDSRRLRYVDLELVHLGRTMPFDSRRWY